MDIKRGDVYYVDKNPTLLSVGAEIYEGRPGVVISSDKFNDHSPTVQVAYFTTQTKTDLPTHVTVRSLKRNSTCLCEQIYTVSKTRLRDYSGRVSDREMAAIDAALGIQFGLQGPTPVIEGPKPDTDAIVLRTERDTYKAMYDNLMSKVVRKARLYDQSR